MKHFCLHQDQQPPFYDPLGHIADPDDLLGRGADMDKIFGERLAHDSPLDKILLSMTVQNEFHEKDPS